MNINEYKKDMDSIATRKFTVAELENAMQKKEQRKNHSKVAVLVIAMVFVLVIVTGLFPNNRLMTITVQATNGEEMVLSQEKITYKLDSFVSSWHSYPNSEMGVLNTELFFGFAGEDIEEITISSSENEIARNGIEGADAYFIKTEKMQVSVYEAIKKELEENDEFLWSIQDDKSDEVIIAFLVGSSYTVKYNEQQREQYSLVIGAAKNEDGIVSIGETLLDVEVEFSDGSKENRKIKVLASDDVFAGLQMVLL
jgi:hypothetical protein